MAKDGIEKEVGKDEAGKNGKEPDHFLCIWFLPTGLGGSCI